MKKLFVLILIIFLGSPVFAEYVPIPEHLSKQYKKEMECIINKEYPKAIKNVDNYVKKAIKYYNRVQTYGCYSDNEMNVINLNLMYEHEIGAEFDIYKKLIKITLEKYLNQNYTTFTANWAGPYIDFLEPYLKDNNVNIKKINDIIEYEIKKHRIIKNYNQKVIKLCP